MSSIVLQGVVHGQIIELDQPVGLPDGQAVTVAITRASPVAAKAPQAPFPRVEEWADRVVFDLKVSPTEKVIKGTCLLAEELVLELGGGISDAELLRLHPELVPEDVAALRSYARVSPGLRQAFGGWAEEADELDEYLAWTRQNRKLRRREIEE